MLFYFPPATSHILLSDMKNSRYHSPYLRRYRALSLDTVDPQLRVSRPIRRIFDFADLPERSFAANEER
jgi:hypothetical protein